MDAFKKITMSPLTGIFDSRSTSDQILPGSFSWKQNYEISVDGKLKNARGFIRSYPINAVLQNVGGKPCAYQNWDWHNQGVSVANRQPVTMLFPSTANDRSRRLYAATKTRIILMDELVGSWSQIGSGYGADGSPNLSQVRFKAAQLQDTIVFVNGFDKVQYHVIGSGTVQKINDLDTAGAGGTLITAAKVVIQYNGVIMIMNVQEAGVRQSSRIWWSDLNNAISWNETSPSSISDFQDLSYGESILAAAVVQGFLYVFTDKSIWRCTFVYDPTTGDSTLSCTNVYTEPENQNRCIHYPNTLCSDGFSMYYVGTDAIYKYNSYMSEPEQTPWIYSSTNYIFDPGSPQSTFIDPNSCESPVMELWPDSNEIYFSWPVVDAIQTSPQNSCNIPTPAATSGMNANTLVINTKFNTTDYRDFGMACYCNFVSDPQLSGTDCGVNRYFFGASSLDFCIKQMGSGYAREIFNPNDGTYTLAGYTPRLRGVLNFGDFQDEKLMKSFELDGVIDANVGNQFALNLGTSFNQMDPNNVINGCSVIWHTLSPKTIACSYTRSAAGYVAANIRPTNPTIWNFLYRDRFLYYDLSVIDANGNPPTQGSFTLSRFDVRAIEIET